MLETSGDDELVSECELSGDDVEMPQDNKKSMELLKVITAAPVLVLDRVMDKWVEKGNDLTRREITLPMRYLRNRHMYGRALHLSEWLESKKQLIFTEREYAAHVDLVAKVHGLQKPEIYIERVLKSFRSEEVYQSLLANYASKESGNYASLMHGLMSAWLLLKLLQSCVKLRKQKPSLIKMSKEGKTLTSKHYYPLLRAYASHDMLEKGKDLVKRMSESGCPIRPLTWDGLIRLYIKAGELEKADSILQKGAQHTHLKPKFISYTAMMDEYAKRSDIHNSEKMFYQMKKAGYDRRICQYQCLIQAYINAKAPCYGIADRMKADNVFPNRALANMLSKSDRFKKTVCV
ncbi:hypothetical protein K7X08_007631 [Anisodus acutangulus]|uniref:Pentatricopeptide repeat-containing protein n=1 Tax=Anisodus acutangulus TaxID=402998 RepID=A0A9Q1LG14_9SOLA|nr:hypothetical protein K7X08_007631 [Anisodus acutangulus]